MITKKIRPIKGVARPVKNAVKKVITKFRPLILSRHPSHDPLREKGALGFFPFRSVVRLGSTTVAEPERIECNSIEGVRNSASKLRMKQCFTRAGIKTADWWTYSAQNSFAKFGDNRNVMSLADNFPIIAKSHFGSRGEGNYKLDTQQDLERWMRGKDLSGYIFEKFHNYTREYRLHVTEEGCFYTCRKLVRNDAPEEGRWSRHDDNCVWVIESNPSFNKPVNWDTIVTECVKALKALGLDICCFDVKVQGARKDNGNLRENPEFIIIESGSAPSFGEITLQKYCEEIPKVLKKKYANR
jgi:hypothetical protein